jgi:hypothetical protein
MKTLLVALLTTILAHAASPLRADPVCYDTYVGPGPGNSSPECEGVAKALALASNDQVVFETRCTLSEPPCGLYKMKLSITVIPLK